MSRKLIGIGTALAVAFAFALSMASGDAVAGEGCQAKAKTASSSCTRSATKTASTCSKSAVASGCCASGKSAVAGYTKTGDEKQNDEERAAALKKVVDELPYRESARIVVAGNMECGHCSYHATASCAPLFKTADGKVYPLAPGNLVDKMNGERGEGFEVTARVRKMDGIKYLDVLTFEQL